MQGMIVRQPNLLDRRTITLHRLEEAVSIQAWVDSQGIDAARQRTIAVHNGQGVLRADWASTCIEDGDTVAIVDLPAGEGSDPLRVVLMIAVMIAAPYVGVALFPGNAFAAKVAAAIFTVGGNVLINALLPPPKPKKPAGVAEQSPTYSISGQGNRARLGQPIPVIYGEVQLYPDYAAQPWTEFAANEQFLHSLYMIGEGEYRVLANTMRFADTPVANFPEVSFQIVRPGEELTLFPAAVETSTEVSGQELIAPNDNGDVMVWLGPFTVNAAGTRIRRFSLDVFANALGRVDTSSGKWTKKTVWAEVEYRAINDSGAPIGSFTPVHALRNRQVTDELIPTIGTGFYNLTNGNVDPDDVEFVVDFSNDLYWSDESTPAPSITQVPPEAWTLIAKSGPGGVDQLVFSSSFIDSLVRQEYPFALSGMAAAHTRILVKYSSIYNGQAIKIARATGDQVRQTYSFRVPKGRYEVRVRRTSDRDTAAEAAHRLYLSQMRGLIVADNVWPNHTLLAVTARATDSLNTTLAAQFNLRVVRKLPRWFSNTGWSEPMATRSIAWAMADMLKAAYGGNQDDSRIDLEGLRALDQVWRTRGDELNVLIYDRQSLWETLQQVAAAGRARPYRLAGVTYFVRDAAPGVSSIMFTQRNIAAGSLRLRYMMLPGDSADGVAVTYWDQDGWTEREVVYPEAASNPVRVPGIGITNRNQAFREACYRWQSHLYRRRFVSFQTELDGHVPVILDTIKLAHDMPEMGQSGEVVDFNEGEGWIEVTEALDWTGSGSRYIVFRKEDGQLLGPILANWDSSNASRVLLNFNTLGTWRPYVGVDRERSHFAFGPSDQLTMTIRVLSVAPRDVNRVEIQGVAEEAAVHIEPGDPSSGLLPPVVDDTGFAPDPYVSNMAITFDGTKQRPIAKLTWAPVRGAVGYLVRYYYQDYGWKDREVVKRPRFRGRVDEGTASFSIVVVTKDGLSGNSAGISDTVEVEDV